MSQCSSLILVLAGSDRAWQSVRRQIDLVLRGAERVGIHLDEHVHLQHTENGQERTGHAQAIQQQCVITVLRNAHGRFRRISRRCCRRTAIVEPGDGASEATCPRSTGSVNTGMHTYIHNRLARFEYIFVAFRRTEVHPNLFVGQILH